MKLSNTIRTSALLLAGACLGIQAAINVPSDGSDGALTITTNTVIDLSQAVTAPWNAENSANAGKGVYDTNKWAVVFKYSSVTIAPGATLTFANHPSRAPVVWLVQGDVNIEGALFLDGKEGSRQSPWGSFVAEPGPGGFRGGPGNGVGLGAGPGFGPGGGQYGSNGWGRGGSYGTPGNEGPSTYGNPSLLPLIGGSGGGGYGSDSRGGGAGGGAILIASRETINIGGAVRADGGPNFDGAGGGSGGGIRLVGNNLTGSGTIRCLGGGGGYVGGMGRIRIERSVVSGDLQISPEPSVVPLQSGATPLIWLPDNGPTARIVSVGTLPAPADPRASFGAYGPDLALPQVATVPVVVETTNAEDASVVTVRVTPRANGRYSETVAETPQVVSASPLVLRWTANVPVNSGYSAIQVKVQRP